MTGRVGRRPPRLTAVFNIQGSELIFLLLVALVVLGPEKLPEAMRKFGKGYAEFRKMADGFQGELRQALDEPMRELRDTADAMRQAVNFKDIDREPVPPADVPALPPETPSPTPPARAEQTLDFGATNPRRQARQDGPASPPADDPAEGQPG